MANRYEDSTQRLHSHNWSDEYKENYAAVFGVRYKLWYTDGTQEIKKFPTQKDAEWAIQMEGDHLLEYLKL